MPKSWSEMLLMTDISPPLFTMKIHSSRDLFLKLSSQLTRDCFLSRSLRLSSKISATYRIPLLFSYLVRKSTVFLVVSSSIWLKSISASPFEINIGPHRWSSSRIKSLMSSSAVIGLALMGKAEIGPSLHIWQRISFTPSSVD